MVDFMHKDFYNVGDLVQIVDLLRGPGGCPWDREQTHASIRKDLLEEAYEAADAIDTGNLDNLKEELGDVLLQVVFHTSIERELSGLTLDQVADGICKKLIFRHPHVFGCVQVENTAEVLTNWEALKKQEKGQRTRTDVLRAVARALPALWRAEKVQKKAEKAGLTVGSDVQTRRGILTERVAATENPDDAERAVGQMLFAAVSLARAMGVDPEKALTRATDEFIDTVAQYEGT
ncbi:MAG: nucleoside triphosphate pyrophosphohydrolase [Oscillospiraceae bacterium]|nr:nucleoside triphosphate pyrophosphohydrolase [Oscillospiraceae bacterium]